MTNTVRQKFDDTDPATMRARDVIDTELARLLNHGFGTIELKVSASEHKLTHVAVTEKRVHNTAKRSG